MGWRVMGGCYVTINVEMKITRDYKKKTKFWGYCYHAFDRPRVYFTVIKISPLGKRVILAKTLFTTGTKNCI